VYLDAGYVNVSITGATSDNFENLAFEPLAVTRTIVNDTIDTTTVTLSAAPESVTENMDGVTFTATLSNPGETAVTVHTDMGDIAIAAGQTTGTLFVSTADPDVYVDPDSITVTVTGVDGGNFEKVDFSQASATAQITDTIDTTYVGLTTANVTENDPGVTFTATLSNPGETAVTVHTDMGDIAIAAGQTTGTLFISTAGCLCGSEQHHRDGDGG
jgi:hypothetical protein